MSASPNPRQRPRPRRAVVPVLLAASLAVLLLGAGDSEAPGLVYRPAELPGGASAHLLVVDLERARLRVLDARDYGASALTAREFVERTGATAAVNASFFDLDGTPLGLLVVDGEQRSGLRSVDWGVFAIPEQGRANIVHTRDWTSPGGTLQALQSGPRLVVAGQPLTLKKQSARRTAVCTLSDGRVELLVVPGSVQASALAEFLAAQGCSDALNLDGGPSTQLYLRREGTVVDVPGAYGVPIALGVFEVEGAEIEASKGRSCR